MSTGEPITPPSETDIMWYWLIGLLVIGKWMNYGGPQQQQSYPSGQYNPGVYGQPTYGEAYVEMEESA